MIELKDVGVKYGEKVVYEHFNLNIEEGEITCILGESGCGKTTLLNAIAGIKEHTGEIPALTCSYVFQTPRLVPNLTVKGNLNLVCKDSARVEKLLEMTCLSDKADSYPVQLSGGEAQRVSLARAFAFDGRLLLMDEPFSSLDLKLKISIMEQFKTLQREAKRCALFVTHDVDEALYLADRIIVLHGGKAMWDEPNADKCEYGGQSKLRPGLIAKLLEEN